LGHNPLTQRPHKETLNLKGLTKPVYFTVLIYGSETWTLKRREEEHLEKTDMKMLRWIVGLTLRDKKRNDDKGMTISVASSE